MDTFDANLLKTTTIEGALFYALIFAVFALLVDMALRHYARRLDARIADSQHKGRIDFTTRIGRLVVLMVIVIVYAHLIPPLRAAGTALLASASVLSIVLGLAAQSTLGNLIAGVAIALYEPFRIGDRLIVPAPEGPESATVEKLTLGNSILRASENRRVVVPNSVMVSQTIINLSS